ncbi:tRNA (N6-isopentenyl adenosine(37)-C2)-methylthiotransferase MiaB [Candidatus Poribacteria bacterium]|nr:tRNA (N6-isopentenyl adenosine(37)-C2)-methylthiotransferase MiaB [Candidatus Poribacteria bacterium]MYA57072.1 tRNA (N6-isopentenyl adenosine(37)-C2)-methylthiotransferase MiaB [Candidatus Poribacteria bacterium]
MKNDRLFPLYNKNEIADAPHPPPQVPQDASTSRATPTHARRVYIETYGCQMNVSDSELMAGILARSGHQTVPHLDDADVVLINTCAIRENAETKVINRLKHLNHRKRRDPELIIGVCGCMAQHLRDRLLEAAPYVDLVMGPDAYRQLPTALDSLARDVESHVSLTDRDPFVGLRLDKNEDYADLAPIRKEGIRAWLTIQRGCDKMCTFCIVPFVRGRERSLPLKRLVEDVEKLVDQGFKEVVLLGQTVNSYRDNGADFGELLYTVGEVNGLERVRFTSPHPADATDSMIDAMANSPAVCKHLHLPLQSGSTEVLQRMRRTYTAEEYRTLVSKLRERVPDIALTTDIIVGFCGETDEEFMETYQMMADIRYDSAFMFKYSEREGTLAHKALPDDVPETVKGERLKRIIELQENISTDLNTAVVGNTVAVLVEGESRRDADRYHGKTDGFKTTVFPKADSHIGDIVNVRVHSTTAHTLIGQKV